jgi:predicted nucleotidyltransferase
MIIKELTDKGLIHPPTWLPLNTQYLTIMGSMAYGVSSDSSDMDVYGFCVPPKEEVFPHLRGEILGFGRNKQRFEQWQEHHVQDVDAMGGRGREYDFQVSNIVKYFHLCMENNPNMIDSLFTPQNCVLHSTKVGNHVRDNRRLFLHKGSWHKFKGYAYSQLHKISSKTPNGKRLALVEEYGYDVKFAYHVVRLLNEVEQIMTEGDLDLQRNNDQLKAIRRGEWTEEFLRQWAADKEKSLEDVYLKSTLPHSPDEEVIKTLLLECLEIHYGSLKACIVQQDRVTVALRRIYEECVGVMDLIGA